MSSKRVSELDELVAIAESRARATYTGMLKSTTARIPMSLYASVATLAEMGGTSINTVLMKIIAIGVEQVEERLSPEGTRRYNRLRKEHVERLFEDPETTSGDL